MSDQTKHSGDNPQVQELGALLQYQEGSVVSRALLKKKGGTVTLFAFDQGEGLSEHTAPFDALVLVLDGEAGIKIGEENFTVRQGETITMPANRPHAVKAITRFKMVLIMIRTSIQ